MAATLDSLSFCCSSNLRMPLRLPPAVSPSSISAISRYHSFPKSSGLKIQFSSKRFSASLNSRTSRVLRRIGNILCEASEIVVNVPTVTDETWQSLVLQADGPVLVEFWAPWCGPCRMLHPVISELSKQYAGKLKCFKMNTDDSTSIATQYGIRSIPTIMIFINGEKKDAVIGAVPKTTPTASIEKFLKR